MRRSAVIAALVAAAAPVASAQPADVAVRAADQALTVSWAAAGGVTYNLYIAAEPGVTVANVELLSDGRVFESVATPFTLGGLDNNRPYFIIIGEVAANGVVLESDEVVGIPRGQWEQALAGTTIAALAADPQAFGVYLAGGAGQGAGCGGAPKVPGCDIFRSADSGVTWESVTAAVNQIDIRALDIRGGAGVALSLSVDGSPEKLFTTANGTSWELILSSEIQLEQQKVVHIDPNDPLIAYAANVSVPRMAGQSRVLKTVTGGIDWPPLNEIVGGALSARTIEVRPGDSQVVWLGGNGTPPLAISSNQGGSFTANMAAGVTAVTDIELSPDNPDQMWIAGSTAAGPTVLFSDDGGLTFAARDAGLPGGTVTDLAVDGASQLLFAATIIGVYTSDDLGQSWEKLGSGLELAVTALVHGPSNVLIAATDDGVFRLDLAPPPPIEPVPDAGVDAGVGGGSDSGCCQSSRGAAGSTALLALAVLTATAGRRRRRRAGRTPAA